MKRHLIFFLFLFVSLMEVSSHDTSQYTDAKLLQKSEMRKDIVIELSYKGFS